MRSTFSYDARIICTAPRKLLFVCFLLCLWSMCAGTAYADTALTQDHYALEGFSSNLPVLVLTLQEGARASEESGYFFDVSMQAFDGAPQNSLDDTAAFSGGASLRNMTHKTRAMGIRKDDYYLRFETPQALAGLGPAGEYMLLGAQHDKSLIRNYVGYTLAAGFIEDAPGIQLCEVFLRNSKGDMYQGVYSLVQLPAKGDEVLFHRSLTGDGIPVETFSTRNYPENGQVYLPFQETTAWDDRYSKSIGALSYAEDVLYSTDSHTFYSTSNYLDIPSFVNQFILGEVMQDYAGMYEGYYTYDADTGLVSVASIWNFEYAADNLPDTPARPEEMGYDKAPYLGQLFKSPSFATMIQERYLALRQTALNEARLQQVVAEGAAQVAGAVQRDHARWNGYRTYALRPLTEIVLEDESVQAVLPYARQAGTYSEELLRLRYTLREHNIHTAINITQFDFSEREVHKEIVLNSSPVWPIVFIIGILLLVRFVRRYGM